MGLTRHATSPVWQRPFDPHRVAKKIRLPSNRDNRRSSHEHQRIHRFHACCRARRLGALTRSAAFDDARRTSVDTCTPPRRSAESGCRSVLGGPLDRFEPSERLLPIRGVVDHGRKARSTSDALTTRPTGRNPEERAERRATSAPSRATAALDAPSAFHRQSGANLRLAPRPFPLPISRLCRLDPASDALSPRASEETVVRRPLPWAHHPRALSPRVARRLLQSMRSASTVSARPVDTLFPPPETEVPCGEEQVRAPCGTSQPRPFGRGSAVAGS